MNCEHIKCARDSVVGIVTHCGLDGPGIKYWWAVIFYTHVYSDSLWAGWPRDQIPVGCDFLHPFLNADRKRQQCQSSEQLLEFFQRDPNDFLSGTIGDHR